MRKITKESIDAFYNRKPFKKGNTCVTNENGKTFLILHNNTIAILDNFGELSITSSGWKTSTTKERLNGLKEVHIIQRDGTWYLNNKQWDGSLIKLEFFKI